MFVMGSRQWANTKILFSSVSCIGCIIVATVSEDEFTKLFKYMQTEFKVIHEELENTATKVELNNLTDAIDAFAKQSETYM